MIVSVVIVTINKDSDDLANCTLSLSRAEGNFVLNVIVVKNEGYGYAHGANVGIKQAMEKKSDYICLLNDDTRVSKYALQYMIREGVDICGAKIYNWNTIQMQPYVHKVNMRTSNVKYIPSVGSKEDDRGQYDRIKDSDYVSCCLLIKREVIEKIGLLDEDYVAYFEDVDYCFRARKAGMKVRVACEAYVWHKLGGSSSNEFKIRNTTRSRFLFMRKNASRWQRVCFYLYYVGLFTWVWLGWSVVSGKGWGVVRAIVVGEWQGLTAKLSRS
jgi:GT2 family glycosyltransferase